MRLRSDAAASNSTESLSVPLLSRDGKFVDAVNISDSSFRIRSTSNGKSGWDIHGAINQNGLEDGHDGELEPKLIIVNENLSVYIELQGSISAEAELGKIKKKIDDLKKQKERLEKIIDASGYREKVPSHIQQHNDAKRASPLQELLSLEEAAGHIESQTRQ
ncbi:hypothetical protein K1719_046422 [Acacia pycnantha]|nr:hypothetical protein K1719_046422 [Acacia pycnantha]